MGAKVTRNLFLLVFGGTLYYFIEVLWRGYSHWSMALVGAAAFFLVGLINERCPKCRSLVGQMFLSALLITAVELIAGLFFNRLLGLDVWDYSDMPYNFLGQICLLYANLWFFLSLAGILLDDFLRYFLFGEEKPRYQIL